MDTKISKIIRMHRLQKSWTQKKLGIKTGLSQSTICRSEIDCYNIKFGYVTKILNTVTENKYDFMNAEWLLEDSQVSLFMQKLKKDTKIWSLINYDAARTANFFIKCINENYKKL